MKFSLTRLFIQRPTLVFVIVALMTFAGILSTMTIVKQLYPDVSQPTVTVSVSYSGASVNEMRDNIVQPIEQNLAGTPDLQTMNSVVQQGQATITGIFDINSDTATDLALTNKAIQAAEKFLPTNINPPTVNLRDPAQSVVVTLALYSKKLSLAKLALYATNVIAPQIEQVPNISFVNVGGVVTPAYEIVVDPVRLAAANLTLNDVINTIQNDNQRVPGGYAYEPNRQTSIDIRGDIQNLDTVRNLAVIPSGATAGAGAALQNSTGAQVSNVQGGLSALAGPVNPWSASNAVVRIGDVATVNEGYEPRLQYAHISGQPGLFLQVQKAASGSEVDASNNVLKALPQIERQFPEISFSVINVQSKFTGQQITIVTRTLMEAILLTGIAMIFFLRSWRSAIVVCVSIPTSLAIAITVMRLMNLTIDTISLLGMSLVIGILVDDSTVVLENIERHFTELKEPREEAAVRGREEIGAAAVVITLVDVVVFFPIAFIQGQVGRQIFRVCHRRRDLDADVVVRILHDHADARRTVGASLALEAVGRRRVVRSSLRRHARMVYEERAPVEPEPRPARCAVLRRYVRAGTRARRRRHRGRGVHPAGRSRRAVHPANVSDRHADRDRRERHLRPRTQAAQHARCLREHGGCGCLRRVLRRIRGPKQRRPSSLLAQRQAQASDELLGAAVQADHRQEPAVGRAGGRRARDVHGGRQRAADRLPRDRRDRRRPDGLCATRREALGDGAGATSVNSTGTQLAPQISIQFDRNKAQAMGVDLGQAAQAAGAAFGGNQATQFETTSGLEEVQVIYPDSYQTNLDVLKNVAVRSSSGSMVYLSDIARFVSTPTAPLVTRTDRNNVIHVNANYSGSSSLSAVERGLIKRLPSLHLPPNIVVRPAPLGQQDFMHQTLVGIGLSMIVSIILVYLLMVALYNSYVSPFIIIFSVPVAAIGAVGALLLTHRTLNLFSLIGTILLIGIATKNGILLVDYANTLRTRGLDKLSAIKESAHTRFRPIIMTSFSVMAGNLPLAIALDPGSASRSSLGIVVIGGVFSSLVLTLLLIPNVYMWVAPKDQPSTNGAPRGKAEQVTLEPQPIPSLSS